MASLGSYFVPVLHSVSFDCEKIPESTVENDPMNATDSSGLVPRGLKVTKLNQATNADAEVMYSVLKAKRQLGIEAQEGVYIGVYNLVVDKLFTGDKLTLTGELKSSALYNVAKIGETDERLPVMFLASDKGLTAYESVAELINRIAAAQGVPVINTTDGISAKLQDSTTIVGTRDGYWAILTIQRAKGPWEKIYVGSQAKIALIRLGVQAEDKIGKVPGDKTVAAIYDGTKTLSGWSEKAGYQQTTGQVIAKIRSLDHPVIEHQYDHGKPGSYYASHAEKQLSIAAPAVPMAVSQTMCFDCRAYFRALANGECQTYIVVDPGTIRVFETSGNMVEMPRRPKN